MTAKRITAAVIGLGQIGLGLDYENTDGSSVLTHAAGFSLHPAFELVGAVDPSPEARERFTRKYHRPAFASIPELLVHARADVFSVGTPTALHDGNVRELLKSGPRALLCEKPITAEFVQSENLVKVAEAAGCSLLVNYVRRFEPGARELGRRIKTGRYGEIYKGVVWYSKGVRNNGSHFIDLLSSWLGEVQDIRLIAAGRENSGDPEPDFVLRMGSAEVHFLAGREECFSSKEIELVGSEGVVRYSQGGLHIREHLVVPSETFSGYRVLATEGEAIPQDLARYQHYVTDALAQHLQSGAPLPSDGRSALATERTLNDILALRSGRKS